MQHNRYIDDTVEAKLFIRFHTNCDLFRISVPGHSFPLYLDDALRLLNSCLPEMDNKLQLLHDSARIKRVMTEVYGIYHTFILFNYTYPTERIKSQHSIVSISDERSWTSEVHIPLFMLSDLVFTIQFIDRLT